MDLALIGGGLKGLLVVWLNYEAVFPLLRNYKVNNIFEYHSVISLNVVEKWNSMHIVLHFCEL